MAETEFAPAKINLTLHVTGRRADGYHLLDSLVIFAGVGDRVSGTLADPPSLSVTGPMAAGLSGEGDNLVLRAARVMGVSAQIALESGWMDAAAIEVAYETLRARCMAVTRRPWPGWRWPWQ